MRDRTRRCARSALRRARVPGGASACANLKVGLAPQATIQVAIHCTLLSSDSEGREGEGGGGGGLGRPPSPLRPAGSMSESAAMRSGLPQTDSDSLPAQAAGSDPERLMILNR